MCLLPSNKDWSPRWRAQAAESWMPNEGNSSTSISATEIGRWGSLLHGSGLRGCDGQSLVVQTVFLDTISGDEYNPLALSRDTLKVRHHWIT